MKTLQTIYKAFNPNYVPVKYYSKQTALCHVIRYQLIPFIVIMMIATSLLVTAGFLNS